MTALNIGTVAPDRITQRAAANTNCPKCGAKKERRVDGGSFGGHRLMLCGECGHEFKEQE